MQKVGHTLGWIFLALVGGTTVGHFFPLFSKALIPLSSWVIGLVKAAAAPLVFLAVLEAIVSFRVQGRDFLKLLIITSINACLAVGVGLVIANIFKPGQYLQFLASKDAKPLIEVDLVAAIGKQLPSSIVQPFFDNSIMPIVIIALAFGFAWRYVKARHVIVQPLIESHENFISFLRNVAETVLIWVVRLVPFAVLAASATISAEHGLKPFKGLGQYVALCLFGMLIHLIVVYGGWLFFYVRIRVSRFWHFAIKPVLYAFSVNSSLVALPLTLDALDRMGVKRRASTLAACVGTNLNNDGIILYEGFTLLALAQASGMDMSLGTQIFAALYCIIAAMGVAGVPEAGIVALTLVMTSVGMSTESLAVLLSVDWVLARGRSALNTSSDMLGSLILNRALENENPKEE